MSTHTVTVQMEDNTQHEVEVASLPEQGDDVQEWIDTVLHPVVAEAGMNPDLIIDWWANS